MFYVYILRSQKDNGWYIGYTQDLRRRFAEHADGKVDSTSYRRPLILFYYEAYTEERAARDREQKLKDFGSSYKGLMKRLGVTV